jgi:Fic family protein
MAEYISKRWFSDPTGMTRRDRKGCFYNSYVPDSLMGREITLDGQVAADITDAESSVRAINTMTGALTNTEALARLLLRAESVASSHIEGLQVGGRRLLRSEIEREIGLQPNDVTAIEVLGNIEAMEWAIATATAAGTITPDLLLEAHRRLLAGTRLEEHGGKLRQEQNWIGGSSYNPCAAAFVPPPPEQVAALLEDLCAFCREDHLPAIAQAAIAHAQFETIHPFVDGNGRTGRVLIHLVLRLRGVAPRVAPPISLILATRSQDYIEGLMGTRYVGDSKSLAAQEGLNAWLGTFASCTRRAVTDAIEFEQTVRQIQARWRRLLDVRANSALDLLIETIPGAPIVTVNSAAAMIGRTFQATNEAIGRLLQANILTQVSWGRRNRAFEATEIIDAFTDLERQLASPQGNTRYSRPNRDVPLRRIADSL